MDNYFTELNSVDVSDKTEKKNGLTYLSWAWAWGEVKKRHPDSNYKIYETEQGCIYWTDGRTAWVKTGVTVNGIEHIEYLPVMDFRNNSIPVDKITSFDVNKAIQRSLTKAVARHGLGLYVYAGEDLPEDSESKQAIDEFKKNATAEKTANTKALRKAIANGDTSYEKKAKGTLDERLSTCLKALKAMTPADYVKTTPAFKDAVNNLCSDLFQANREDEANELRLLVETLAEIERVDFNNLGE